MQDRYGFVYVWYDRKHRRYYVGSRWGIEDDGYVCSSAWMMQAYKRRPDDFKRKVVARVYTNRIDLLSEEHRWLQMIKPNEIKTRYYNFCRVTKNPWHSRPEGVKTIGQKISHSKMGKKPNWTNPADRGRKISEGKKGKTTFTDEHRQKLRDAKLGKTLSAEHKKKIGESGKRAWDEGRRV